MLVLTLRQAEAALADGRLDHAYELLRADNDLLAHARGQRLLAHLVKAYLKRGERHLSADRPDEAMVDCDRARRLAGNLTEIADLRRRVIERVRSDQDKRRRNERAIDTAQTYLRNGRLSAAGQVIQSMDDPMSQRAVSLKTEVESRRAQRDASLAEAESALQRGALGAAARALGAARQAGAESDQIRAIGQKALKQIETAARDALRQGHIDEAGTLLAAGRTLSEESDALTEIGKAVRLCHQASEQLSRGDARRTLQALRRLESCDVQMPWLDDAIEQATRAAQAWDALRCGPLSMLASVADTTVSHKGQANPPQETAPQPTPPATDGSLPEMFVLQVDGVGAFLVVRTSLTSVGPVSSADRPKVGVVTDPNTPSVNIERRDGDYFLTGEHEVRINDATARQRLLADGDRVGLSPRCRFKFSLPNAASTTAVLDFSTGGARLPRADVRQAVLLGDALIIGPAASAHVRTSQLDEPIVLQLRDGALVYKGQTPMTIDGRLPDEDGTIGLDARVCVDTLTFVLTHA